VIEDHSRSTTFLSESALAELLPPLRFDKSDGGSHQTLARSLQIRNPE
jgi:hypothetical protein